MTTLIVLLVIAAALLLWSATTTCSLNSFEGESSLHSQLSGPDGYRHLTEVLPRLPGVRVLQRNDHEILVSVMPVPSSMGRLWGLFVTASLLPDGDIVLAARSRLPLPGPHTGSALGQLEREIRQLVIR